MVPGIIAALAAPPEVTTSTAARGITEAAPPAPAQGDVLVPAPDLAVNAQEVGQGAVLAVGPTGVSTGVNAPAAARRPAR